MSNKCEPPNKSVDALGASEAGVNTVKSWITMLAPVFIYSYAVPAITSMLFVKEKIMVPGPKPVPSANMTELEAETLLGQDAPMVEVDAPGTWAESFVSLFLFVSFMSIFVLISIWTGQEGMLYVPAQPIQYIEQNPPPYLSPEARGIQFEEIWLKTKDNIRLQGWFMFQGADADKRETLIFFHENAGNIGLRLDWF